MMSRKYAEAGKRNVCTCNAQQGFPSVGVRAAGSSHRAQTVPVLCSHPCQVCTPKPAVHRDYTSACPARFIADASSTSMVAMSSQSTHLQVPGACGRQRLGGAQADAAHLSWLYKCTSTDWADRACYTCILCAARATEPACRLTCRQAGEPNPTGKPDERTPTADGNTDASLYTVQPGGRSTCCQTVIRRRRPAGGGSTSQGWLCGAATRLFNQHIPLWSSPAFSAGHLVHFIPSSYDNFRRTWTAWLRRASRLSCKDPQRSRSVRPAQMVHGRPSERPPTPRLRRMRPVRRLAARSAAGVSSRASRVRD